jgi:hypothetical protein
VIQVISKKKIFAWKNAQNWLRAPQHHAGDPSCK